MAVTLDQLYNGVTKRLSTQKKVICDKCEGRGTKNPNQGPEKCSNCRGTGRQVRIQQMGPNIVQQIQTICSECSGAGEKISSKDKCKNCDGKKFTREKKILQVHIEKGMEDGQKIVFTGEGDFEPGLDAAGDIIVVLDEQEHPTFKRVRGDDLVMNMELTLTESLCGLQKGIKTLDDRTLVITSLPGEVIKHGSLKCILNEGMPHWKDPFTKGKLIIQFLVKFPEHINPALISQLESILPPRPRVDLPTGDLVEEVTLMEIDNEKEDPQKNHRKHYYDEDEGPHAGVQCPTH